MLTAPRACSRSATLAALESAKRPPSVPANPMKLSSTLRVGTNVVRRVALFSAVAASSPAPPRRPHPARRPLPRSVRRYPLAAFVHGGHGRPQLVDGERHLFAGPAA